MDSGTGSGYQVPVTNHNRPWSIDHSVVMATKTKPKPQFLCKTQLNRNQNTLNIWNHNSSRQAGSHLCASVTMQYNSVPAKAQWCSVAGKVTVGLTSHQTVIICPSYASMFCGSVHRTVFPHLWQFNIHGLLHDLSLIFRLQRPSLLPLTVHFCRVADNTVWSHMASDTPELWDDLLRRVIYQLTFNLLTQRFRKFFQNQLISRTFQGLSKINCHCQRYTRALNLQTINSSTLKDFQGREGTVTDIRNTDQC